MEAERDEFTRRIAIAGEAMNHAAACRHADLAYDRDDTLLGIAAMNHDRKFKFGGEFQMSSQRRLLRIGRRMHVMEVEAALANRDDLFRLGQFAQRADALGIAIFCVVWVHS